MTSPGSEYWRLPAPVTDELGCGVIARFLQTWDYLDRQRFLAAIFGFRPKSSHAICVPSVRRIAESSLGERSDATAHFIRRHSLLAYFLAFATGQSSLAAEERFATDKHVPIGRSINASALTWGCPVWLRVCESCLADQLASASPPVWQRCHQLPGISRCRNHGSALINTRALFGSDWDLRFPTVEIAVREPNGEVEATFNTEFEAEVAAQSIRLLDRGLPHDSHELKSRFRGVLHQVGYLGRSHEVRASMLSDDLRRWLLERGCSLENLGVGPWWLRLSTELRGTPTPLQVIVFRLFLESRLKTFSVPCPDLFGFDLDGDYRVQPSRSRVASNSGARHDGATSAL